MLSYIKSGVAEGAKLQTGGLLLMFSFMLLTPAIKRLGDCGYSIGPKMMMMTMLVIMMMMIIIIIKKVEEGLEIVAFLWSQRCSATSRTG